MVHPINRYIRRLTLTWFFILLIGRKSGALPTPIFVLVVDSYIQHIVLATEETTVTQQVSHRPIDMKCQSRPWLQRGVKINGSHHGDSPLLKPTGIQIATKSMPDPINREHRKLIDVKTMSLGTNYSLYCLECCQYIRL